MKTREELSLNFSNGTDFEFWYEKNCCLCKKYNIKESTCIIEQCLYGARFNDGKMRKSLALAIGFNENGDRPKKLKCFKSKYGRPKGSKTKQRRFL